MSGENLLDNLLNDAEWLREMHAFGQHWWLSPTHQRSGTCPICLLAMPYGDAGPDHPRPVLWHRPIRTGRHSDYRAIGRFRLGK